jgi:HAE1 family hydrophobic/amphiphilic exporter-1
MRDAIVRPLEDQIAGAPDLSYVETSIEPGQASIVAVFSLSSDENTDLVQVQGRVQNSLHQLPNDLPTPQISIYNPSEAVVVSLAASSTSYSLGQLSAIVTNDVVPAIEQVPGVSYVQENGDVTSSIQVNVDPQKISASGFTLTDVINAIANNNVRAPGGIVYEPNRETNLDIRGDVQDVPTVGNLLVGNSTTATTSTGSSSSVYPWTATSRLWRISDVANVQDAYETQRVFAYTNGTPAIELDVQKAAGSSEVTASNAVIAQLPKLEQQYPQIKFSVLDVYAGSALGRDAHADRRHHHHRARDAVLPALVAQGRGRDDRGAGVVLGDARGDERPWLYSRHGVAARHDVDDRYPCRRLDRRAREHFTTSRGRRTA